MNTDKLDTMIEAFAVLREKRAEIDRLAAAELPNESLFSIKWKMVSECVNLGSRCTTVREAGNLLELLTEEIPVAIRYAVIAAKAGPDRSADEITLRLQDMLETAGTAIGNDVYKDMAMDLRRPPSSR
ncbi:hypothetical protein G6L37_01065 [Agrobacterium rubi]|nr:hypothetical protein [Agrobacterium rubi]NTF23982.1 hypothetical protein [Agrobacterium rubi]